MSLKITDVVSWRYNPEIQCIEFTVNMPNSQQAIVTIPETKFAEIIEVIPELEEEKQLNKLIEGLYSLRNRRFMTVEEVDKLIEDLRKKHEDVRKELATAPDKLTVFRLSAISKDLATEKVLIDTKRHLCMLLMREEARLRADIAKKQALAISR